MTGTDIATRNGAGLAVGEFTDEQIDLIKRTIAKDATNDELALFVHQAQRSGLDPFSHQIWFTKRSGKMSILTGIDGYRLIADRTGRYAGQDGPFWCGPDGQWVDVWLQDKHPAAAKVVVKKILDSGAVATMTGVALWAEYGAKADGFMWPKMPAAQLAKCAEALALRKAFPAEMSGMYVREEMDQAGTPEQVAVAPSRQAARPATVVAGGKPVDSSTGEVRESRPRRPPPNSAGADDGPVLCPDDVRDRLGGRMGSLHPDARDWLDEQIGKRGLPGVDARGFTAAQAKLLDGLLSTAEKIEDPF